MIPSSKCRPRNSAGRFLVKALPYQIGSRCLQQSLGVMLVRERYSVHNGAAVVTGSRRTPPSRDSASG